MKYDVTIVVPMYNEEANVSHLHKMVHESVSKMVDKKFQVIYVDDGSTDATWKNLSSLEKKGMAVNLIRLRRNFGQTAALSAGFDNAEGDVVIPLDADLQNDPADIPLLLKKIDEGYDIVSGWRKNRKDKLFLRKIPSMIANAVISKVTGVKLKDYGCTLKAYRKEVLSNIKLFGDMHRFIPALASWQGIKIAEIEVRHHRRKYGKTKYGIGRTIKVLLDLLTVKFMVGYISRPIQMFGPLGLFLMFGGFAYGGWLLSAHLFLGIYIKPLRPLVSMLLIITGMQLVTMGLLGEMIMRNYFEAQGKPIYMVREKV